MQSLFITEVAMNEHLSADLLNEMRRNDCEPLSPLHSSTNGFYRFSLKPGWRYDDSGWIKFYPSLVIYGDMRTGSRHRFYIRDDRSYEDNPEIRVRIQEERIMTERQQATMTKTARSIFQNAFPASSDHPYLLRKCVESHGLRETDDGRLLVPGYDETGYLTTVQFISSDGSKRFLSGCRSAGCFFLMGDPSNDESVFLVEGYATGASAYEQTGTLTFVAFCASNLSAVAQIIRKRHPDSQILILADNDESKTGEKKANEAADVSGAEVILMPEIGMDVNDFVNAGGDIEKLIKERKKNDRDR